MTFSSDIDVEAGNILIFKRKIHLMETMNNTQQSDENHLELIQKLRNDLLKDFLDERYLMEYLSTHFNVKELSPIKLELIKKALKELFQAPLDPVHYSELIAVPVLLDDDHVFFSEIENVLKRYIYY